MKMKLPHVVPLSTQAIVLLRELKRNHRRISLRPHVPQWTPAERTDGQLNAAACDQAGGLRWGCYCTRLPWHGQRRICARPAFDDMLVELQLAHADKTPAAAHTTMPQLPARRAMMAGVGRHIDAAAG